MNQQLISQDQLKSILQYDSETGRFSNVPGRKYARKNDQHVGRDHGQGYLSCTLNKRNYLMHRLAWLYVYGNFPDGVIDHINGIRCDNRISNLRKCSHSENLQNQPRAVGAHQTESGKWRSELNLNGVRYSLGLFKTKEEAHAAYLVKKHQLHPFSTSMHI